MKNGLFLSALLLLTMTAVYAAHDGGNDRVKIEAGGFSTPRFIAEGDKAERLEQLYSAISDKNYAKVSELAQPDIVRLYNGQELPPLGYTEALYFRTYDSAFKNIASLLRSRGAIMDYRSDYDSEFDSGSDYGDY